MGGEVFVYHTRVKYTNPPPTTKSNTRHTTDRFNPYRTLRSHYSPLPPHRTTSKQHPTLVQFFKSTSPPRRPPLPLSVHLSPHWLPKPYTSESPPLSPMRGRSPSPSPMRGRSPSPSPMRGRSPSPLPMRGRSPSPRPVSPLAPDDRPKVDYNRGRRFTKLKEPDEVSRKRVLEEIEIEKRKKLETGSGSFWKSLTHNQAERMSRGVSPPTYRPTIVGISKKVSDQQSLPSSETGYHSLGEMEHQSHNTQAMVSQVLRSIKSIRRAYEADKVFQKFESKMKSGHTSLRSVERHPKEVTPSMRYPSIESYRVMIPVQPKSDGRLYRSQEIVRSPRSPRPRSISPPNIDYRSYILSILRTLKKSERFLQLHNCYTSLDQIAKLERFLIEMDKMNRKRFGNFRPPTRSASLSELDKLYSELEDAQRKKAFFYRVKTKEQVQWTMEKDRGLRCRDHSVEDLRRIYVDSKRKMWRGQGYDKNGLNRTSRSVSELVDKYSSLENLEQQGIQEEVFTRSSFYRRSVRSVSPTYRQQQRTGFKGQSKHEGNSQRRPRSTSGVERDVTIHPHVPVCWWNNKVASVRQSYEGIILKNREDDGDERAHSLPRSMGFRYQAGTPSTIDYSDSERLSPASIPSNYSGLRPWTYLDVASSWNDLPVKGKHSSMFVQKKYPPPVNYFTPNYLPERSVSTIDLTRANDEISPFGHMHDKAESLSHSSCMSDLGSQDSMIIHDVSKDPRAQASAMNANDEACFKDHQTKVSNFYLSSIKAGDVRKLQGKFESMEGTASKDETWQMIPHSSRSTVKRKTVGESSAASEIPKKRGIMPVKVGDGTVQKLKEKFEEEKLLAKTKDSFLAYKTHSLPRNFSAISGDRSLTRVQIKPSVFHSTKEEREKRDRYNELGVSDFVYSRKSPGDVKTVVQKFESVEDVGRMDSPEDNKLLYISVTSRSTPDITIDLGEVDIPETPQQHQVSRVYLQTSGDRQEKRSVRRSPTGDDKLDRLWKKYVGTSTWPQKESEMTASSLGYDRASLESRSPSPSRKADVRDLQRTYTYSPLICTTPTPMGYAASGDEDDVMDGRTLTPTFTLTPASTRTTSPTKMVDGGIMRRSGSRSPSGRQTQTLRDKRTGGMSL
uniref:Uncharacterized protein n=1 Tax=Strigamia maritima TaxID=126957 RepID=T1IUM3_STRMM